MTVLAVKEWATNAHLMLDCARLGYLNDDALTLDATYGKGTFWKLWVPARLITADLYARGQVVADFTALPFRSHSIDNVVFDPPFKLNGAPDGDPNGVDGRYGVHIPTDWRDRLKLMRAGLRECARVLGNGYLLAKCQDQVCSGKMRWQTTMLIEVARDRDLGLVDRFDFISYRPQPASRRQLHARHNASQLLIFKRGW